MAKWPSLLAWHDSSRQNNLGENIKQCTSYSLHLPLIMEILYSVLCREIDVHTKSKCLDFTLSER